MNLKRFIKGAVFGLAALFVVMTLLSGCAAKQKSLYERITATLKEMENYEAEAYVRYISNNKTNTYLTNQKALASGEYRIEVTAPEAVAGNTTIFDGKIISQYNKNVNGKISVGTTESMERLEILLTSFVKNYFESNEVSVVISAASIQGNDETVLEAKIPGDNKYLASEKLWINNETLKPVELKIYDEDGNERVTVVYNTFEYNTKLDKSAFTVTTNE